MVEQALVCEPPSTSSFEVAALITYGVDDDVQDQNPQDFGVLLVRNGGSDSFSTTRQSPNGLGGGAVIFAASVVSTPAGARISASVDASGDLLQGFVHVELFLKGDGRNYRIVGAENATVSAFKDGTEGVAGAEVHSGAFPSVPPWLCSRAPGDGAGCPESNSHQFTVADRSDFVQGVEETLFGEPGWRNLGGSIGTLGGIGTPFSIANIGPGEGGGTVSADTTLTVEFCDQPAPAVCFPGTGFE